MNNGKVALCLSGAGAKGIVQAGEVQAFLDLGLQYDMLYGSSAGSLNGAILHQGEFHRMKDIWMNLRNSDVYKWSPVNMLDPFNHACLYDSSPLKDLITKTLDLPLLFSNNKPFYIAATNYTTWTPYVPEIHEMAPQEVVEQLYASASAPIYFPFQQVDGNLLSDAGILSNFCIKSALDAGADTIVVMGFSVPEPTVPKNLIEAAGETISIGIYGQLSNEFKMIEKMNSLIPHLPPELGYRPIKLVKIFPPKSLGIGLLDFDLKGKNREELWQYGYDLAHGILSESLCS